MGSLGADLVSGLFPFLFSHLEGISYDILLNCCSKIMIAKRFMSLFYYVVFVILIHSVSSLHFRILSQIMQLTS
jgi:hypothetical protein